ncbi:hypothetical protein [Pontibacter chinhatensis]|nr:hypothetical protein [Pontibacter chinhatensis]
MTSLAVAIEPYPSLWVERLVDVAVPEGEASRPGRAESVDATIGS